MISSNSNTSNSSSSSSQEGEGTGSSSLHRYPSRPSSRILSTSSSSYKGSISSAGSSVSTFNSAKTPYIQHRQALLASLEDTFSRLEVVESGTSDLTPAKNLLKAVALAVRSLEQLQAAYDRQVPADHKLSFDVFNLAFHRLSAGLRCQFLSIYVPNCSKAASGVSLQSIIAFLQAEIVSQHSKSVWLASIRRGSSFLNQAHQPIRPFSNRHFPGTMRRNGGYISMEQPLRTEYCRYCKTTGHLYENCLNVRQLLCFQCYQEGHTKRSCPFERGC